MIYIKVPKEITEYKSKAALGMTWQQLKQLIIGALMGILLSFLLYKYIGNEGTGLIITFCIVPSVLLVFINHDGIPMDIFVKYMFRFYTQKQKLSYETSNMYKSEVKGDVSSNGISFKDKARRYIIKKQQAKREKKLSEKGN